MICTVRVVHANTCTLVDDPKLAKFRAASLIHYGTGTWSIYCLFSCPVLLRHVRGRMVASYSKMAAKMDGDGWKSLTWFFSQQRWEKAASIRGTLNYKYLVVFLSLFSMFSVRKAPRTCHACCLLWMAWIYVYCIFYLFIYDSSDALHHINRLQAKMPFCKW